MWCLLYARRFLDCRRNHRQTQEHLEVHAKVKALFEALGKMWEADEAKYDQYIQHNSMPVSGRQVLLYLRNSTRRLPTLPQNHIWHANPRLRTPQQIQKATQRPKKRQNRQRNLPLYRNANQEPLKPSKFTEKQCQTCLTKLRQAGITDDELALFKQINGENKSQL